ncbi:response regulator transcription factor [Paenibacillus sp. y28]|uniref:response regulator transcription factor n=1 Tax=Paenibacillus sp. y28 TaxID=3129110 RepID=UPI003015AD10
MLQLLIVDDEIHVVERFSTTIDWRSAGIEQVYQACSGAEALQLLEQFSIDIVLTDIQMPGMSGLELIAEINRKWPKTKCILLSGHSDFEYAQEAIKQKTEDYLLKPATDEEVLEAVSKVRAKLTREWEDVVSNNRVTYALKENLPLLRGNLLLDLLQGRGFSEAFLRDKMQLLELPDFYGQPFAMLLVRLEGHFAEYDLRRLSLMEYAISNMVAELFDDKYDTWYTKDAHDYLVFVLKEKQAGPPQEDVAWIERTASLLQASVHNYLKGQISVLVSGRGTFPADITPLYSRSLSAFRRRIGSEHELFMRLGEDEGPGEWQALKSLYEPPSLQQLLEAGEWTRIKERLGRIFGELERDYPESREHLQEVFFSLASAFTYIAHKNGRQLFQLIGSSEYDRMNEGGLFRSVHQLSDWSYRVLDRLRTDMEKETKDSRVWLIQQIRAFIDSHLADDVSLQSIADHVYLHPVYVSKIYKLETGENISDYMHAVRMERAEHLLKHGQDKIYEIAARLGYQRPHSFNHAFKKQFGITPQEYRERYS